MNQKFIDMLSPLENGILYTHVNTILTRYWSGAANNKDFYENEMEVKRIRDGLFSTLKTTSTFLEECIVSFAKTPFNIFSYILNGEEWSDILIHSGGINLSDGIREERWVCPEKWKKGFDLYVNALEQNVIFLASQKFDTGNNILDIEISDKFRFNMIHESLTNSGYPVIVIRKQTVKEGFHLGDDYVNSLNCTPAQVEMIQKLAYSGNVIIFGETGSGKTTLLKYMCNYRLSEKRNLCIIEDTKELNVPVPISLLTNHHATIKQLFTAALRENPSHIVIGETRTSEIIDILESALTINVSSTIHANSFSRAIERIIFMSLERKIEPNIVKELINASIDCFIYMEARKVKEIWVHTEDYQAQTDIFKAYRLLE